MKANKKYVVKRSTRERKVTTANEVAETKAIEEWLQMVDKPLKTKEIDTEPRD